jgi:hypothetical protein
MARKTKTITIPQAEGNRDSGKTFLLTEMSAAQSEKWALRALGAIANSGMEIPPDVMRLGMGTLVAVGFKGLLTMQFDDAEPLLDEMMQCVVIVPDPKNPNIVRPVDDEDIEDIATRLMLRSEVFELHTGFSPAGFLSKFGKSAKSTPDISDSSTSPNPSETPSPADGQP